MSRRPVPQALTKDERWILERALQRNGLCRTPAPSYAELLATLTRIQKTVMRTVFVLLLLAQACTQTVVVIDGKPRVCTVCEGVVICS